MAETGLRRKVGWLIALRAIVSTFLLGSAIIARITVAGSFAVDPLFFLIALTYALTVAYALTQRRIDAYRWLVDVQLAVDALIVSAFIALTGGITSYFTSLYVLPIIAGSTLRARRGGLLVATFTAVLYVGLVLAQYLGAPVPIDAWTVESTQPRLLPTASVVGYTVTLNVFGFFAVALLSGSLANSLRSAGARLQQASTAIADLEALNQQMIDNLPSGLATTDAAGAVLAFNRAAEDITGMPSKQAIGRRVEDVLQLPSSVVAQIGSGSGTQRHEVPYRRPDGRGIEIGLTARRLEAQGSRTGLLFTFQDVTTFKRLERDAARQERLAAVGEMAAGIAHEIRNPLASMSGSIQILREELPLNAEQEQLMDIVLRESERLNTTIRSFLAYARPPRSTIARFDVRRVLSDTAVLLRNSAEVADHHVVDLDVPDHELWCEADEGQMRQVVWNLATNGLRAMPTGGRLRLAVMAGAGGDGIELTVKDEGVGIAAADLEHLFQPFHGHFAKGSGLGLAIVHRIVSGFNGDIQVRSQQGHGTTVSVLLPARSVAVS